MVASVLRNIPFASLRKMEFIHSTELQKSVSVIMGHRMESFISISIANQLLAVISIMRIIIDRRAVS